MNILIFFVISFIYQTIGIVIISKDKREYENIIAPLLFMFFWPIIILFRYFKMRF